MAKAKYNYLIVGTGIESLLKGLRLQQSGKQGCLIEKEESAGGLFRGVKTSQSTIDSHLFYLPDTPLCQNALADLQHWIPELEFKKINLGPLTFQNGQIQPFLGFAETDNEAVDICSEFTPPEQILFSLSLSDIVQRLRALYTGDVLTLSEVTAIELSPEVFVMINGSTKVSAEEIFFFEAPTTLAKLLLQSQSPLPKNLAQKLAKTPLWTTVSLIYQHREAVTESRAMHILYGAKEQASLGRFSQENTGPTSQWLSFVSAEVAADSELLGGVIREMKKQIKRMYPRFFEVVEKENILIAHDSYGIVNTQLLQNDSFAKVPHLKLGSRFYTSQNGLLGDLISAYTSESTAPEQPLTEVSP